MLENLGQALALLQNNQDSLDRGLQLLAPFYRVFANALGNGRWFDNYICNLGAGRDRWRCFRARSATPMRGACRHDPACPRT